MNKSKRIFTICISILICMFGCERSPLKEVSQFEITKAFSNGMYHTLDAIYGQLNHMKQTHPEIVRLYSLGRSDVQQRQIPMIRITFNRKLALSNYLFVAGTHGDEASGVEALLYIMQRLMTLDKTSRDNLYSNGVVIYFIPVHNPDGFAANQRENGHGVDLNRNFPFGYTHTELEPETEALVELINSIKFQASIFFHSANVEKYENVVRVPVELGRGQFGPTEDVEDPLWRLAHIVEQAGNTLNPAILWQCSHEMVDASGIASDWASSGLLGPTVAHLVQQPCINPHPSVSVELCFPKQPMDAVRLQKEKDEALRIVQKVITEF